MGIIQTIKNVFSRPVLPQENPAIAPAATRITVKAPAKLAKPIAVKTTTKVAPAKVIPVAKAAVKKPATKVATVAKAPAKPVAKPVAKKAPAKKPAVKKS